jgi:tetratricopeptide (TPR) repeat protein
MKEKGRAYKKASALSVLNLGLAAGVAVAGILCYAHTIGGVFVFDDDHSILENPYILHLWPISRAMSAPPQSTLAGRPIASLSLALNYAISGYDVWSYHILNLLIHIFAGLTLFGIVRRTLESGRLKVRFGGNAAVLAWAAATIWVVHPVQTESVTYIVQRTESMMGLFYLLTLYSAIRSMQSGNPLIWSVVSTICCGLGMGTKEVMVTAPVLVLLYDRMFGAGSFKSALSRRGGLYAGLAATWGILAVLIWSGPRSDSVGFSFGAAPVNYALNQGIVIMHYLRLSFWPSGLCLDYNWPTEKSLGKIIPPLLAVSGMSAAVIWGLVRNRSWSYPAAWFFAVLAPTSSFVPIVDLIFEHRMYLPLAGLAVLSVMAGYAFWGHLGKQLRGSERAGWHIGAVSAAIVAITLMMVTIVRNNDYNSAVLIWQKALDVVPNNPRAYTNLAAAYGEMGQYNEALDACRQAMKLKPDCAEAYSNLGNIYVRLGKYEDVIKVCEKTIKLRPNFAEAYNNLGFAYGQLGRYEEAVAACSKAVRLKPYLAEAHSNLGAAYNRLGCSIEAIEQCKEAIRLKPSYADAYYNLGVIYSKLRHYKEASEAYKQAVKIKPDFVDACFELGIAYRQLGRYLDAVKAYKQAIEIRPDYAEVHNDLGVAYGQLRWYEDAIKACWQALKFKPDYADAHYNLGIAYLITGQADLAREQFEALKQLNSEQADKLLSLISGE